MLDNEIHCRSFEFSIKSCVQHGMRPSPIYAPRYSQMLDLPLQLILLCLLVLNTRVEGQQCRLVMPSHTRAASGGSHSTTTSLPSSTATPGTTSGGNVTSTQTAFAYGKQPVRGVNLYVRPSLIDFALLTLHFEEVAGSF